MPKRLSVVITTSPLLAQKKMCTSPFKCSQNAGSVSQVNDFLFIGDDRIAPEEVEKLQVTAVVDCRTDGEVELRGLLGDNMSLERLHLPLRDNKTEDASRFFFAAVDFIEKQRAKGGKILVHCTRGISRSSAVVCAYLIWSQDMSCRQALSYLRSKHSCADPNPAFTMQLLEFGNIRTKNTVAYEISGDGKTMTGPLAKDDVDRVIGTDGVILLVSKSEDCQFIYANNFGLMNMSVLKQAANMLADIRMAPRRIELVDSAGRNGSQSIFSAALTYL